MLARTYYGEELEQSLGAGLCSQKRGRLVNVAETGTGTLTQGRGQATLDPGSRMEPGQSARLLRRCRAAGTSGTPKIPRLAPGAERSDLGDKDRFLVTVSPAETHARAPSVVRTGSALFFVWHWHA